MFPMAFYRANLQEVVVVYHDTGIDLFYLFYKHFIFLSYFTDFKFRFKSRLKRIALLLLGQGFFLVKIFLCGINHNLWAHSRITKHV